jgi:hypothetical protein
MFESIKKRIFPFIIALSAFAVSGSAAFYSVTGLSKLFAGASLEVIIMASSLEISKLVIASLLYQYWEELNKILRTYLTIAAGVLILITSMGIYGFLSNAYVQTANLASGADAQITLLESKKTNLIEQRDILTTEKSETLKNISDLRVGLTSNVQTTKDKKGNILTSSSSANRTTFERQLDKALSRQETVNSKIDEINTEILTLENQILETKSSNEAGSELGPLKYLSGLTGISMDVIINYLLLVIIFVFDPLAIALVIAANFAFNRIKPQPKLSISEFPLEEKKYEIYNELKPPIFQEEEIISDPIEDFDDSSITISEDESEKNNEALSSFSTWRRKKANKLKDINFPHSENGDNDYIIKY